MKIISIQIKFPIKMANNLVNYSPCDSIPMNYVSVIQIKRALNKKILHYFSNVGSTMFY